MKLIKKNLHVYKFMIQSKSRREGNFRWYLHYCQLRS